MNVFTDILIAYFSELRVGLSGGENKGIWPIFVNKKPLDTMKAIVKGKHKGLRGKISTGAISMCAFDSEL
jgi:hypothetical protein